MAEAVPKVQEPSAASVKFIFSHDVPFHFHAAADDVRLLLFYRPAAEAFKEALAAQHAVFDDLSAAAAVFPLRQGTERSHIAEHQQRLIKAAHLVFAGLEVDGGLTAHGGIHRGQQSRWHLHKADAAQIGGCGKARQIPHHAAAQGDKQIAAGHAVFREEVQQPSVDRQALGGLAGLYHKGQHPKARRVQRGHAALPIERKDILPRDHHGGTHLAQGGKSLAQLVQQALADQHLIVT